MCLCVDACSCQDLGSPSEKIWPGYNELPAVKKMTFTEYPYNNLRKRFGALLSDQGFDLMNKYVYSTSDLHLPLTISTT